MLRVLSVVRPLRANYEARALFTTGVNPSEASEDSKRVGEVYSRFGIQLSDPSLMTQSITHKSFKHGSLPTNEKLSYLGRTFLEMHITERKWDKVKSKPTLQSTIADGVAVSKLAGVARENGVDKVLRWKAASSASEATTGQESVLAQTMEAIVGAVYHDQGSKAARDFVVKHVYPY
ncbi:hypothetical protein DFQ27_001868 [Actinomortierella ambigua]|uniref:RNase III domain-containing protein n=1 Tax=Actinomortierella ambigua TaxID=1343610 RepID=A0A9P6QDJ3_9FUNG|nr:hypothetical protein DFQ26_001505 [Actinomortierella ambigua]KAG0263226.1 hypothetical protein DFQ27_001868 [Actinomortierella ambigua]